MKRTATITALTAAGLVLLAGPASAHVTVHGPEATEGGFAKLTFQVPTEKAIPTTKLQIAFPADQPLAFVNVEAHPGWRIEVTKSALPKPVEVEGEKVTDAVSQITWTAQPGQGIKPGYFDEFSVSAGFLPTSPTMTFKALQTYSDGSVVSWIELPGADGKEPEHPAPVLHLASSSTSPANSMEMGTATAPSSRPSAGVTAVADLVSNDRTSGSSTIATALGATGLGVGLVGLGLGGTALARTRRRSQATHQ